MILNVLGARSFSSSSSAFLLDFWCFYYFPWLHLWRALRVCVFLISTRQLASGKIVFFFFLMSSWGLEVDCESIFRSRNWLWRVLMSRIDSSRWNSKRHLSGSKLDFSATIKAEIQFYFQCFAADFSDSRVATRKPHQRVSYTPECYKLHGVRRASRNIRLDESRSIQTALRALG